MTETDTETSSPAASRAASLRSRGMHDLGPDEMRRFRGVEARFLEVTAAAGYREIRTPTVEPLHLFTGAGALSPQLLDRVYSFLDWDGWSGERMVLRPDSTLPAVRWFESRADAPEGEPARLSYVQPVYRFDAGDGERELWQCGVELFGLAAPEGDVELLGLAGELLSALGLGDLRFEIAHAGLLRAALAAAGLDPTEQIEALDRVIEGGQLAVEAIAGELSASNPERASGLRLLLEIRGSGEGYLDNVAAALPEAAQPIAELRAAVRSLAAAGIGCDLAPSAGGSFEYYTGLTFRVFVGGEACLLGGRYDGMAEAVGGRAAPASGFAADLLRLAALSPEAAS